MRAKAEAKKKAAESGETAGAAQGSATPSKPMS